MARSTPIIQNNRLLLTKADQTLAIPVGSGPWFEWLSQESSTIFSFQSPEGSYTARKESAGNRRGGWYWKAYRKYQGNLYRAYLGKPEDLTGARLAEIALVLSARVEGQERSEVATSKLSFLTQSGSAGNVTPLLETKLQPPRLPAQLVARSHLLALLDAGQSQKLTLLQAPAGFGKTTLVAQWVAHQQFQPDPAPVAWISLDSGGNDPVRFWSSLIRACRGFQGQPGQTALAQLSLASQLSFAQPSLETVLTLLLNDLARLGKAGIFILEDYHLVEHHRLHETLAFFIEHLPAPVRMIILTRSTPPLPLLRWRARGDLLEIQGAQLRFLPEETASFVQQLIPQMLSQEAVRSLHRYLEGWAAGLRLLALSLQSHMTPQAIENALRQLNAEAPADRTQRPIQEYFLSEVLAAQPEPLQLFLLQTSLLGRLSGSLCDAVTGRQDSAEWLELALRSGFFLEALDSTSQQWYRYHALFAETMRAEAVRRFGEAELSRLSSLASHWYEAHSMPEEAIEAAISARQLERAARLIEKLNEKGYFSEHHTMRRWLEQFPEVLLRDYPELCFLYAQAQLFSQDYAAEGVMWRIEPVEGLLQLAEEGWRRQGDLVQVGIVYAFRATFTVIHGFIGPAVVYARQALQLLPPPSELPVGHSDRRPSEWMEWRCGCLFALGLDAMQTGSCATAYQHLFEAYSLSLKNGDPVFTNISRRLLAGICLEMGQLYQAASYYQQTLASIAEQDNEGENFNYTFSMIGMAQLSYEWNDLEKAEYYADEVTNYNYKGHFPHWEEEMRMNADLLRLQIMHARGEITRMWALLPALFVRLQATPTIFPIFPILINWQTRLQIQEGDLAGAERTLNTPSYSEEDLLPLQRQAYQVVKARLLLARGEAAAALALLEKLLPVAQDGQHLTRSLEIQLLMALVYTALKRAPEARQQLYTVLSQARSENFMRLFLDEGEPVAALLRALFPSITEKSLRAYTQHLLRAFTPSPSPGQSINQTEKKRSPMLAPLSNQEQRVLRLLVAGQSNPEIARTLTVSVNTVKGHVKNIYRKLDVANRVQAGEVARRLQLL